MDPRPHTTQDAARTVAADLSRRDLGKRGMDYQTEGKQPTIPVCDAEAGRGGRR